ncbi:MAG TPA: LptE family protein [Candidatus Cybelea sp.]|nr:LptE family protein [Candidatus Cybelea sp.]
MAFPRTECHRLGRFAGVMLILAAYASGCGYHVAGTHSTLPANWRTIAIPAFKNDTTRYRIEEKVTEAVIREFIARTNYRIIQDQPSADAVLHGEIVSVDTTPMLFNSTTGEVTQMLVSVHTKVELLDNKSQKPVYQANDMVFRQEYQISTDAQGFFQEQDPALGRMAHDFAAKLVANVMEGF